jgi:hypothetical protein
MVAGAFAFGVLATSPVLADSMYSDWDADRSGAIDNSEFDKGLNGLKIYDAWDKSPDSGMSREDFSTAYGDRDWGNDETFDAWDADDDAQLTRQEWRSGAYDAYDADANEELDEEEFGMFEGDADEEGWFD